MNKKPEEAATVSLDFWSQSDLEDLILEQKYATSAVANLSRAVACSSWDGVQKLISAGFDTGAMQRLLITESVRQNNLEVLEGVLSSGIYCNSLEHHYAANLRFALEEAVNENRYEVIDCLFKHRLSPLAYGRNLMNAACKTGNLQIINALFDRKVPASNDGIGDFLELCKTDNGDAIECFFTRANYSSQQVFGWFKGYDFKDFSVEALKFMSSKGDYLVEGGALIKLLNCTFNSEEERFKMKEKILVVSKEPYPVAERLRIASLILRKHDFEIFQAVYADYINWEDPVLTNDLLHSIARQNMTPEVQKAIIYVLEKSKNWEFVNKLVSEQNPFLGVSEGSQAVFRSLMLKHQTKSSRKISSVEFDGVQVDDSSGSKQQRKIVQRI